MVDYYRDALDEYYGGGWVDSGVITDVDTL